MKRSMMREGRLYATLAVLTVVLAGADIWYFTSAAPAAAPAAQAAPEPLEPVNYEPIAVDPSLTCSYNPEIPPVADFNALITEGDVIEGNPEAPVTVIEYFEPNCPHCRTFYPVMKRVMAQYGDQARFVVKPVVFWDKSLIQGQALYAAAAAGKFDAMLAAQFADPKPDGLTAADVRAIADRIGMDGSQMLQQIESGAFRGISFQARQSFQASGNRSVPAVLINGRTVSHESRTAECLAKLIEEAAATAP